MVEQTLCPLSPELVSRDTDCAKAGPSLCECRLSKSPVALALFDPFKLHPLMRTNCPGDAGDAPVSPIRILVRHAQDQFADRGPGGWSPGSLSQERPPSLAQVGVPTQQGWVTPGTLELTPTGYAPLGGGGPGGWLHRYQGLLALFSVLALCLLAGLLVGHWVTQKSPTAPQVIKVEGTVEGDLHAERSVYVDESGNLRGNIHAPSVYLSERSRFNGSGDMDGRKGAQQARPDKNRTMPAKTGTSGT